MMALLVLITLSRVLASAGALSLGETAPVSAAQSYAEPDDSQ
jgi:hypothetical protein